MNPTAAFDEDERKRVAAQFRVLGIAATLAITTGFVAATMIAVMLSTPGAPPIAPELVLYPAFPMFLLVALVLTVMGWKRIGGVFRGEMPMDFYRTFDSGAEPESYRVVTRNFINLFEMPLLFHVGVILAYVSEHVTAFAVGLAWSYVGLRYVHTYVHLTSNDVAVRLSFYMASGVVLLTFWVVLFVGLVSG